ncbi:type I-B CRISPR-associated protein Cas8b/Csh1 [Natronobiforma cellulositropha]|uniref:type I-B CRISPR-associated protein Cas8b/Csh1 n=1 Tax=Natronobiforma cellulositropha TaxID=1679076 RepID=UPI0021D5F2D8|nr:type I-B CRISPR-associated protein Cas8b/Csh1 [Natronobiforma cellulositropha]
MLSPEAFRDTYPPEKLRAELPETPIGSLRDVQFLYGKLYTLATTGGGEYASYLTPDAADGLVDTDDSLLVVRVDVSSEPALADDAVGPVQLTRYTADLVQPVGHCKYAAARGIDHSITHQAGQNSDPEKLARYAKERLTKWPTDDVVSDVAETHPEGWIIDRLAELGAEEQTLERIEAEVIDELGGESATALLTVQVKTERDGEYRWPGEIDVFLEAMRQRKLSKLVTKNKANDSSGEATDLVTETPARTVGTAEDPQNYYLGKQLEKFPGLDIEHAWRSHPISEDAAVTVMNAETFVEACTYRTFGAKVYCLPYFFGRSTVEKAYKLYNMLYRVTTEDDEQTPIEDAYKRERDENGYEENTLRFYVAAVMPHQMSRYDVFGETLNGRLHYPKELAIEHGRIVEHTSAFNTDTEWSPPLPTNEKWNLLSENRDRLNAITTGWYFHQTFAERDDAEAEADDPRIEVLINVLSGEPTAVELLLEEYVERIITEQTSDEFDGFPSLLVASQFAQLCAMADDELELLTMNDPQKRSITDEPTYEEYTMSAPEEILIADGGHPAAAKLESFIEQTPALVSDPDDEERVNDQRRGAFLLGALVGDIGSYQEYSENRSTTLVDQYPVKSISRSRIKKVTQETIAKTLTYTRAEKKAGKSYPGTKAEHIVERLRETILNPDPGEWTLDTDDLRFYYALGVTYGINDHPDWDQIETDDEPELEEEH